MQKYALLGFPLIHSLSPKIHSLAYAIQNINAEYSAIEIKPAEFEYKMDMLKKQDINGFNVTIPYKSQIIPYLDCSDETVLLTGAVNTIKKTGDKWYGYNTDVKGFLNPIKNKKFKSCLVLGNGGSARSVVYALLKYIKPNRILIAARNNEKSISILKQFQIINRQCELEKTSIEQCANNLSEFDLIVNTTPVGMFPNTQYSPLPETVQVKPGCFVYDLIYNPKKTKLLIDAEKNCSECFTINGMKMLIAQALESIKIWTGVEIAVDSIQIEL